MLIETKHTKITAELEQRITGGYYREKLPPLRALMKEYQVSLQTISKAVKPLILSGLISPGPRGSAINHASAVRERYYAWGFLCSGSAEMTDVTHDFFQLIHRCLARDSYNMLFLDGRNKRLRQDMVGLRVWNPDCGTRPDRSPCGNCGSSAASCGESAGTRRGI